MPFSVFDLSHLLVLDLSINKLTRIPEEIGRLQRLEKLFLFQNKITVFPTQMNIPKLELVSSEWFLYLKSSKSSITLTGDSFRLLFEDQQDVSFKDLNLKPDLALQLCKHN